jgi:thioredoxin 1
MMKTVHMFITSWCPYCDKALKLMEELKNENSDYTNIDIKVIDEELQPELSSKYDYYYVPTYYLDNTKLHEGAVSKDILTNIFNKALEQ